MDIEHRKTTQVSNGTGEDNSISSYDDHFRSVSVSSENDLSEKRILGIPERFLNVLLLGFGFMFNVGALQTCVMSQTVVLNSVHDDLFNGTSTEGYVVMAINCATQAVAYLLGASTSALIGPKVALVGGSVCVVLYIACFLRPLTWTIYVGSVLVGFGVGTMWAVQGHFVAANSRGDTVERNYGIFWGLFQSSLVSINLFYFLMLYGANYIDPHTRFVIFSTLLVLAVVGTVFFCLLRHPWTVYKQAADGPPSMQLRKSGARAALVATIKLGLKKEMLLLVPHFFYIGMQATFWASVYSTSLGYTLQFGDLRESLVGLNGVFLGVGEIAACIFLAFMGKWSNKHGRDVLLIGGMIVHFAAFYLIFLNLPPESPIEPTSAASYIGPNPYLAMFCTLLFGIGDAIWTNQLMAYLGWTYPYNCVAAFGVYQFYCAIVNAAAFWYSTVLSLPFQFLLLICVALPASAGFCYSEWKTSKI